MARVFLDHEILRLRAAMKNSPGTAYVCGTAFHAAVAPLCGMMTQNDTSLLKKALSGCEDSALLADPPDGRSGEG